MLYNDLEKTYRFILFYYSAVVWTDCTCR